jgi:hypothetical protein
MASFGDPAFYGDTWAGLALAERYETWDRRPFGPESPTHVSVYRK